jgi:hypothetical protein
MGIDYLKRFDWGLAARIQRMSASELAGLLAERLAAWQASGRRAFSDALDLAVSTARPMAELVDELVAEGCTLTELRNDAIHDLCLQGEDVPLDARGSWAEVLLAEPAAALSSLDVLPGTEEERFLLLRPQHLDAVLRTVQEGVEELPARSPSKLEAIARLRDACAARPGLLVAYCFDA